MLGLICRAVRKEMQLLRPRRARHLPKLLPDASLKAFYSAVDDSGNLQHQIMLRLLFYTAVRVSELASIAVDDVGIEARKIRRQSNSWICSRSSRGEQHDSERFSATEEQNC